MQINLATDLSSLIKNKVRVSALKTLGIETVQDLLQSYPFRLESAAKKVKTITELYSELRKNESQKVILISKIVSVKLSPMAKGFGKRLEFIVEDEEGRQISAVFFAKNSRYLYFLQKQHSVGEKVAVVGNPKIRQTVQFVHPLIITLPETVDEKKMTEKYELPIPVYHANSKISSEKIHASILEVMNRIESQGASEIKDPWESEENEADSSENQNLIFETIDPQAKITRWEVLKNVHSPRNESDFEKAFEQLRFEETLILQTLLLMRKNDITQTRAIARVFDERGLANRVENDLPFKLTSSQKTAVCEVRADLSKTQPMRRLLQGDVGSGKTIVAVLAMLQVFDNGGQSVLIAPTEVLANQHFQTLKRFVPENVKTVLLTGAQKKKERELSLAQILSGDADLIVATHAAFSDKLSFKDLGLVVVDEQHRFGVEQRDKLLKQNSLSAHLLIMSATPIPRTVAMCIFADVEVSSIDELPNGRKRTKTFQIENNNEKWKQRLWEKMLEEINLRNRVFIVVPRIDESDSEGDRDNNFENELDDTSSSKALEITNSIFANLTSSLKKVEIVEKLNENCATIDSVQKLLKEQSALKNQKIAVLTSRNSATEKEEIMQKFISGETPILLSTTVVEVGVDVPNATIMAIFDADRFGAATLHQLRGRVGRSNLQSFCFLLQSDSPTEQGLARLNLIEKTLDGFKIAEEDLELRGAGDIIGANQAGTKSSLKLLNVLEHREIIDRAHQLAQKILKTDPTLKNHLALKAAVEKEVAANAKEFLVKA